MSTATTDDVKVGISAVLQNFIEPFNAAREQVVEYTHTIAETQEALMGFGEAVIAAMALEKLKEVFKEVIETTFQYTEQLERLKFVTGETQEGTQQLSNQLAIAGIDADTYTGILVRMERQLRQNPDIMIQMGLAANRAALSQMTMNETIDRGIKIMEGYKAGFDRNSVAIQMFGRNLQAVIQIQRMEHETQEMANELHKQFGVTLEDQLDKTRAAEFAVNALTQAFKLVTVTVGSSLTPYVKTLANTLRDDLAKNIKDVIDDFKILVIAIDMSFTAMYSLFESAAMAIQSVGTVAKTSFLVLGDVLHGDFKQAQSDSILGTLELQNAWQNTAQNIGQSIDNLSARVKLLATDTKDAADAAGGEAPGGTKIAPDFTAMAQAKKLAAERFALEQENANAIAQMQIDLNQSTATTEIKIKESQIKAMHDMDLISDEQQEQMLGDLKQQEIQASQDSLTAKRLQLTQELAAYKTYFGETAIEYQKFAAKAQQELARINQAELKLGMDAKVAAKATGDAITVGIMKPWTTALQSMENQFQTILAGFLNRTMTWKKAFGMILTDLGNSAAKVFMDIAKKWIQKELMQTTATEIGTAARAAAEDESFASSLLKLAAHAIDSIISGAASTFAGVFGFLAPEMGPAAAGPAGASMAAVLGAQSMVAFDQGAWEIPHDMTARIHKGETIMPRPFAEDYRDKGGSGGKGLAIHMHVHALDTRAAMDFITRNPEAVARGFEKAARNAHPSVRKILQGRV